MKKNSKFQFFSIINLKNVSCFCSGLLCLLVVFVSAVFFFTHNLTADFVGMLISSGAKTDYVYSTSVCETMLSVSLPSAHFEKEAPTEKAASEKPLTEPLNEIADTNATDLPKDSLLAEPLMLKTSTVSVTNLTKNNIDIEALLLKDIDLSLSDEPSVLILHTHTTESYTPSERFNYYADESFRTLDESFNVTRVGALIAKRLEENGINVIHDKKINDYPSYSKSYSESLKLMEEYKEKYPSIKIIIDVHRDAIGDKGETLTSFDTESAQVMLVVGTDAGGLYHPLWQDNLSFALKLQREMDTLYPTLARSVNIRKERFNQHVAPYSFILEVGTNLNTMDQALRSAEYFSLALISLLKV